MPPDPDFRPLAEGWKPLREPKSMLGVLLLAVPTGIVGVIGVAFLASAVGLAEEISVQFNRSFFAAVCVMIAVHELLHAAVVPGSIRSPKVVIGIAPKGLAAYAHYEGAMNRERFLLVMMTPIITITAVTFLTAWFFAALAPHMLGLAVVNAFVSGGDLFGTLLVGLQVPRGALVRNSGMLTYWLPSSPGSDTTTGSTSPS